MNSPSPVLPDTLSPIGGEGWGEGAFVANSTLIGITMLKPNV